MDQRTKPAARLDPLPADHTPELKDAFAGMEKRLGFVPNSMLTMQRKPDLVKGFAALSGAIWQDSAVDDGLKRLVSHVASHAAGCQYCMAHTAGSALLHGMDPAKVEAVWDYQTSPLFSAAERAALDVAVAAACVPNAVTDAMFLELRKHFTEEQIVELVAVIAIFGFLNRWNDTMATPLEAEPIEVGEKHLAAHGWSAGKHAR